MMTLVASLVALCIAGSAAAQTAVDYRFDDVKRKVVLTKAKQELRVEKGQHAQSGDKVQTGWFSYALIAAERYRARFEIFSSTDVQLASGTPGVILSLERGRIRAAFDKIVGNEPRVVQTPGALLAVRGTKYDVEVDNAGRTTVDVWEGTVEVRSRLLAEPMLVHAGQESVFGRREPPKVQPMPDDRRRNDPNRPGRDNGPGRGPQRGDPHGTPPPSPDGHDHHPPPPGSRGAPPPPPPPKP
ncbi:MAG TPA: FecR domain-containing protein [Thermoanaerobaculia bacterium]